MSSRRSPFERAEDVVGDSMAPYGSASVHGAGGGGFVTRLPAPVVRELQLESVDRYLCAVGSGAIVLVPEGAEVPVAPKDGEQTGSV